MKRDKSLQSFKKYAQIGKRAQLFSIATSSDNAGIVKIGQCSIFLFKGTEETFLHN